MESKIFRFGPLLVCMLLSLSWLNGCQGCFVTPNPKPTSSPTLAVNVWDYNCPGSSFCSCPGSPNCNHPNDITGPRTPATATNPYQYGGVLDDRSETSFDSTIGVHAHDPTGVSELDVTYVFACQGDPVVLPLESFNNTATQPHTNKFTLTSTINNGQVTTDLAFPITVTSADLKTVTCSYGQLSSGVGTLQVLVTAQNFSTNQATKTTFGYFQILIGAGAAFLVPPGVAH